MQDNVLQNLTIQTHGERISLVTDPPRALLLSKVLRGTTPKLSKIERTLLAEHIAEREASFICDGVNFSRLNVRSLLHHQALGGKIEFETLGPYLSNYSADGGIMTRHNLSPEDAIGLQLAGVFRRLLPAARLVSLYDDYNVYTPSVPFKSGTLDVGHFTASLKQAFRESLVKLYKTNGVLPNEAAENIDYIIVSESSKVNVAAILAAKLDAKGYIQRRGQEIIFVNTMAENPLHHRFHLRNNKGKWLCEALDAATFLDAENLLVSHIVMLPDYMKAQQDKVWEILRILGVSPYRYHNIFYNSNLAPSSVAQTVMDEFARYS
jgi:hypothetical protein